MKALLALKGRYLMRERKKAVMGNFLESVNTELKVTRLSIDKYDKVVFAISALVKAIRLMQLISLMKTKRLFIPGSFKHARIQDFNTHILITLLKKSHIYLDTDSFDVTPALKALFLCLKRFIIA